ncbi:MAG: hypothetical protein KBG00_10670 [Rhodoferax sp.]|jgi:hypothetical protein|uniref:hypothetical protein n=1 Tax=Rhodoferax sp. TaxID=50421 RepID=UPI001B3F5D85|nr:hypothetical protein [Rhodoferax sp.]MBP9149232.1 hypothetical protein [Rhodoferax sp.]MBP9736183.1 hypothetical protein [Rhodoferax sp.]
MTTLAKSQADHAAIALASLRKTNSGAVHRIKNATRVNPNSGTGYADQAARDKTRSIHKALGAVS